MADPADGMPLDGLLKSVQELHATNERHEASLVAKDATIQGLQQRLAAAQQRVLQHEATAMSAQATVAKLEAQVEATAEQQRQLTQLLNDRSEEIQTLRHKCAAAQRAYAERSLECARDVHALIACNCLVDAAAVHAVDQQHHAASGHAESLLDKLPGLAKSAEPTMKQLMQTALRYTTGICVVDASDEAGDAIATALAEEQRHINRAFEGVKAFYEWMDADIALTAHAVPTNAEPDSSEPQPGSAASAAAAVHDTPDNDAGLVSYVQVIALAMPADALAYELEQLLHAKSRALEQRASLLEAAIADASAAKQLVAATKLSEYQAVEADNTAGLRAQVAGLERSVAALRAYVSHTMDEQLYQVPQVAEHVAEMRENIATFVQDARRAGPDASAAE